MSTTLRTPGSILQLSEASSQDNGPIIREMQILKTGRFYDPRYKWFEVSEKILSEMIKNFQEGVRGIVPALDYAHDSEGAAAGWIKELFLKDGDKGQKELWGKVELTPRGQKTLADKEFGYISADFDDSYQDNETGKKHGAVLLGAALTNRPVIKKMDAVIQLSEEKDNKNGGSMDPKDMEKKLMDAEKQLGDYKKLMEDNGVDSVEGLMKMIADLKAKVEGMKPSEVELGDMKKELSEMKTKNSDLEKKIQLSEKETEFTKLLTEGKVVAAQREAFIEGNVVKFAELSQVVKTQEQGHGGASSPAADVEEEILKEAMKLSEEKKLSMKDAISEVLLTNKSLSEKRAKALEV
jgi:phage I-like protein